MRLEAIQSIPTLLMHMPASTPIARSKTAALSRVLDSIPKGYHRYIHGTVNISKAEALIHKFHQLYGIGCTPAQRITRKAHGKANTLLVVYWPEGAAAIKWLLLATEGTGLEGENLIDVRNKPRPNWLGYELVRHPSRDRSSWTWRRPKAEMAEHYAMLAELSNKHYASAIEALLQRLANQPGFYGVRTQTWELSQEARRRGFEGDLPYIYFVQKVSHGDRFSLDI
jgi:hypothetical protein